MQLLFLILGTVSGLTFIISVFNGQKYDELLKMVDGSEFVLKSLCSSGMAFQEMGLITLRSSIGRKLLDYSNLYYGRKKGEIYASVILAQAISFSLLLFSVLMLLAGMLRGFESFLFSIVAMMAAAGSAYYFVNSPKSRVESRRETMEMEFPNAITKLALLINSGLTLHSAWSMVANGKTGIYYDLMKKSCDDMENGVPETDAIYNFGMDSGSDNIKRFTTALVQSIEYGGDALPEFLANQSYELWMRYKQLSLQKGEKAASALLMPVALMFVGVVLIVIAAAMLGMSL